MRLPNTDGSGNKILLPLFGCLPVIWLAVLFAQAIQPGMGLTEMSGKKVEKTPDSSMIDDASCMSSLNAENFALFGLVLFGFAVAIKKKNN